MMGVAWKYLRLCILGLFRACGDGLAVKSVSGYLNLFKLT
jgi:hypothetical protein